MSSQVRLFLRLNGQTHPLPSPPLNYEELLKAVNQITSIYNFTIKLGTAQITSSRDLIISYLNNKEEKLVLEVEEIRTDLSCLDSSSQAMAQSMLEKFKHLIEEKKGRIEVRGGTISKEDLLRVIIAIKDYAFNQLTLSSVQFQQRRLELYEVNEEQYKKVVLEQIHLQKRLMMVATVNVCKESGIGKDVFEASCEKWYNEAEIQSALEAMASESPPPNAEVPASLTQAVLKQVLVYSCGFINRYIDSHPHMHQIDALLLKIKESDEVMKRFGYNESEMTAALAYYRFETDPYWEDVHRLMNKVSQKLFQTQGFPRGPQVSH